MKNWILRTFFKSTLEDLDQARVQLAGVLTAAEGYTQDPAKRGDWGWSLPYQKTLELRQRLDANEAKAKDCMARLDAVERIRNVSWPRPATRIPEHVVLKEFNVPLDQGLMAALHQELDDQIQELLDVVSQPPSATLTAEHRLHLAGGIEHLRLFQKSLLDRSAAANTADEELEKDDKEGV